MQVKDLYFWLNQMLALLTSSHPLLHIAAENKTGILPTLMFVKINWLAYEAEISKDKVALALSSRSPHSSSAYKYMKATNDTLDMSKHV